jgi:hypothetical protein
MGALPKKTDDQTILLGVGLMLVTLLACAMGMLLVWFAMLRENPVFWTNVGGYPVWLRDLVLLTYLPLFVGTGLGLSVLSMICFLRVCRSRRFFIVESLVLLTCWGLLATSGYIALANNVRNFIDGRDLHEHRQ